MRFLVIFLLLLNGCGLMGNKDDAQRNSRVSAHDRDRAECEMQALEAIPPGPGDEARMQRYTRLCMQARGYPVETDTRVNVKIRE